MCNAKKERFQEYFRVFVKVYPWKFVFHGKLPENALFDGCIGNQLFTGRVGRKKAQKTQKGTENSPSFLCLFAANPSGQIH